MDTLGVEINSKQDLELNADPELDPAETDASTLQQLKAKKNKSNLFLIKSYSFIERNNYRRSKAKLSTGSVPAVDQLQSPDMEPFADIESMVLAQFGDEAKKKVRLKKPKKEKPKPLKKAKKKSKEDKLDEKLLRRHQHHHHEYEEILEHNTMSSLPRPQSLPAKVHFDLSESTVTMAMPLPTKRSSSSSIKRESFLRQSLQSIRRSFGSNKHSAGKMGTQQTLPLTIDASSSTSSTASSVSMSSSITSCSAAISLLAQVPAHNRRLDEMMPTPVVLLLNDDLMLNEEPQTEATEDNVDGGVTRVQRSTSSVSRIPGIIDEQTNTIPTSMAPLQLPAAGARAASHEATLSEQQQQHQQLARRQQYSQQYSLPETSGPDGLSATGGGTKERSSLRHSYSSSLSPLTASGSVRSLGSTPSPSPSPRSSHSPSQAVSGGQSAAVNGCPPNTGNTAKQHDQQTSAVAAISSTSAAAGAASASSASTSAPGDKDKEKKRKEVSSSRVKKFHRHFSQVSKDEKLINYFSCALVSDILLQGHLYITDQHFAFYSNVFGYVTKFVIPTSLVTKISKEKTAKIIPNAVGVATKDERHVFGSFISRESAFRLMCTVCPQIASGPEILPKPLPVDIENSEDFFIEDDSSCSISGNESPPQLLKADVCAAVGEMSTLRQRPGSSSSSGNNNNTDKPLRHSDHLQGKKSHTLDVASSTPPPIIHYEEPIGNGSRLSSTSTSTSNSANVSVASSGPPSSSSSPVTVVGMTTTMSLGHTPISTPPAPSGGGSRFNRLMQSARTHLRLPLPSLTELHLLYLGIILAIMLALFSVFLLYRILDIEAKTSLYHTPIDFNWRNAGNDEDIFAEALRWQKEMQAKSTEEAQHILSRNLEQISKVRRSLETLSMLIHDRRAGYDQPESGDAAGQVQVSTGSAQRHDSD